MNVVYHDGSDPHAMHNYYTYLYNKAVFNLLKEVKGEKEAVLFARSATAGGQQFRYTGVVTALQIIRRWQRPYVADSPLR